MKQWISKTSKEIKAFFIQLGFKWVAEKSPVQYWFVFGHTKVFVHIKIAWLNLDEKGELNKREFQSKGKDEGLCWNENGQGCFFGGK